MKIGYFADGPWAHQALEVLLATDRVQLAFIVARHGAPDPVLREYAERLGVPFLVSPNVNAPEFIERIRPYGSDLHISMSFDQILRAGMLQSAPKGFINCHAGALPFYRGRNVLNWALINGEPRLGVTVHYVDDGIDTGDIIVQRFADITLDDNYDTVLRKAVALCADTLTEAIRLIESGEVRRIPQSSIHPVGFYCGRRREGDEWIDWSWPSHRIHNFVRGITSPGPGARTYAGDATLAVLATELIPNAPEYLCTPGEVVGRDGRGNVVKSGNNSLRVTQVAAVGENGLLEEAKVPSFQIGTRLGCDPMATLGKLERRVHELEVQLGSLQSKVSAAGATKG